MHSALLVGVGIGVGTGVGTQVLVPADMSHTQYHRSRNHVQQTKHNRSRTLGAGVGSGVGYYIKQHTQTSNDETYQSLLNHTY